MIYATNMIAKIFPSFSNIIKHGNDSVTYFMLEFGINFWAKKGSCINLFILSFAFLFTDLSWIKKQTKNRHNLHQISSLILNKQFLLLRPWKESLFRTFYKTTFINPRNLFCLPFAQYWELSISLHFLKINKVWMGVMSLCVPECSNWFEFGCFEQIRTSFFP